MEMMPPAASEPHGSWNSPTISCRPTGQVREPVLVVSISAKRNSFQAPMATNTAVATRPPSTSGSTTRTMAPSRLAPSMRAASSRSFGTPSKKPFIIQMKTGSRKVV
jgi:hypothetical protein